MERALDGVAVPVFWQGEQVGERRNYNDRLLMFILRHRLPDRYGPLKALMPGTRHPDTLAREAAEMGTNGADSDAEADAEAVASYIETLEDLLRLYEIKLAEERAARRAGRIVEADFTLRQATHVELMIEIGGGADALIAIADGENLPPDDPGLRDPARHAASFRGALTQELDRRRRAQWESAGDPRARRFPTTTKAQASPSSAAPTTSSAKPPAATPSAAWPRRKRTGRHARRARRGRSGRRRGKCDSSPTTRRLHPTCLNSPKN